MGAPLLVWLNLCIRILNESRPLIKRIPFTEGHISLEKEIRAEVYKTSEGNPQVNLVPEIYCFPLTKVLGK